MDQPKFKKVPRPFGVPTLYSEGLSDRATRSPEPSVTDEHEILTSHVGLVDRSSLTKLKLLGKDSIDLLQRLSTNDLKVLVPGFCLHTVLTTERGRVLDLVTLYYLPTSEIVLISHAPREKVFNWIERFIIMEDVSLSDITLTYSLFSLLGPELKKILAVIGINQSAGGAFDKVIETRFGDTQLILGSAEPDSASGANIVGPVADADTLWTRLVEEGRELRLEPCGINALEIRRVEHGFPVYGRELTEEVNPLEAGLGRFVSFSKGCYIGQEVIARLETHQKLKKRLVGLLLNDNAAVVMQGARIAALGNDVGWVTSAAQSPRLNRTIALAYVRSAWAVPNTSVDIATESGMQKAQVVQLPFEV